MSEAGISDIIGRDPEFRYLMEDKEVVGRMLNNIGETLSVPLPRRAIIETIIYLHHSHYVIPFIEW